MLVLNGILVHATSPCETQQSPDQVGLRKRCISGQSGGAFIFFVYAKKNV